MLDWKVFQFSACGIKRIEADETKQFCSFTTNLTIAK
jgi:hypothetical protein